ncbi:MAG: hypothetical protein EOO13_00045 [Chitinophagaceae bacterium]|nr:MAG: hypothetical protein EOO13_00045 [Chitinophagaceae bacterium]
MKRKVKRIDPSISKPPRKVKLVGQNDDGFGTSVPPSLSSIEIYFDQKGVLEIAVIFFDEYESRQWKSETGQLVKNWKVCAAEWIYNYRQEMKRRFRQSPFYSESYLTNGY